MELYNQPTQTVELVAVILRYVLRGRVKAGREDNAGQKGRQVSQVGRSRKASTVDLCRDPKPKTSAPKGPLAFSYGWSAAEPVDQSLRSFQ